MNVFRKIVACLTACLFSVMIADAAVSYATDTETPSVSEITPEVKAELEELGIDVNSQEFQAEFSDAAVMVQRGEILKPDVVTEEYDLPEYGITPESANQITPNGCSYSPDRYLGFSFKGACDNHDRCYAPGSRTSRLDCDRRFLGEMIGVCNRVQNGFLKADCTGKAGAYYAAVRTFGGRFYKGSGWTINN